MLWYEYLLGILMLFTCVGYILAGIGYALVSINRGLKFPKLPVMDFTLPNHESCPTWPTGGNPDEARKEQKTIKKKEDESEKQPPVVMPPMHIPDK